MLEITDDNFDKEVKNSKIPVIIDFWAEWCGPCKMLAPVFEAVSKSYKNKLKFVKVDAQTNRDLAINNGVSGIPCLIIFNKGEEVDRLVGYRDEARLKKDIDAILHKI